MAWSILDNAMPLSAWTKASLIVEDGVPAEKAARCRNLLETALGISPSDHADGISPDFVVRLRAGAPSGGTAPSIQALPGDGVEIVFHNGCLPNDRDLLRAVEAVVWSLPDRSRHLLDRFVVAWQPDREDVLAVVSADQCAALDLRWAVRLLEQRFRYVGRLRLAVPPASLDLCQEMFADRHEVCSALSVELEPRIRAVVLISLTSPEEGQVRSWIVHQNQVPIYELNPHGMLWPIVWARNKADGSLVRAVLNQGDWYPNAGTNAFTRLAARRQVSAYNVHPMRGRLIPNGIGPIDALGYRNGGDFLRLVDRPRDHLVVAMFGGSGCHGDKCFHDDTIAAALERRLNRNGSPPVRWTVLNFGVCGYILAEEFQSYLATCWSLRPDVVISHTGNNDLYNGMLCDPKVLGKYQSIYLAETFLAEYGEDDQLKGRLAPPDTVISAYLARVRQFATTAAAQGAHFIFGVQPLWYGKELNAEELEAIRVFSTITHGVRVAPERLHRQPFLYERLRERKAEILGDTGNAHGQISVVDVHERVVKAPQSASIFVDNIHLSAEGNDRVAECYADALADLAHQNRLARLNTQRVSA